MSNMLIRLIFMKCIDMWKYMDFSGYVCDYECERYENTFRFEGVPIGDVPAVGSNGRTYCQLVRKEDWYYLQ